MCSTRHWKYKASPFDLHAVDCVKLPLPPGPQGAKNSPANRPPGQTSKWFVSSNLRHLIRRFRNRSDPDVFADGDLSARNADLSPALVQTYLCGCAGKGWLCMRRGVAIFSVPGVGQGPALLIDAVQDDAEDALLPESLDGFLNRWKARTAGPDHQQRSVRE
jgi:hypothetical protein